ncbi:MAG: AAA family ATPase, partial [Thauera sp.]
MKDLAEGFARHLVAWAAALDAPADSLDMLAAVGRRLALANAAGHVCVPLAALADIDASTSADDDAWQRPPPPASSVVANVRLRTLLCASGVAVEAAQARAGRSAHPLVLDDGDRLYLRRSFDQERALAQALVLRAAGSAPAADVIPAAASDALLDTLFPPRGAGAAPDWQRVAVMLALRACLTVISGGPGTGKTTTVAALLACLLAERPTLRIALAAPTGKAAARMLEAL